MAVNRRALRGIGKPNLEIDVDEPIYEGDLDTPVEDVHQPIIPVPTPTFEKMLADEYPWLIEGKPNDSKLLFAVWWLYTRLRLYKFKQIPLPREVWSYAKAAEERKEASNKITVQEDATGQVKPVSYKGGVGKTNVAAVLSAAASIATGEDIVLIDVNLDGATVLSRFPIDPELMGRGMTTPELVALYETAIAESKMWQPVEEDDPEEGIFVDQDRLENGPFSPAIAAPTIRDLLKMPNRPYKDPVSKVILIADDFSKIRLTEEQFEHALEYAMQLGYLAVADTPPGSNQIANNGIDRKVSLPLRIGRYDQEISLQRVSSMRGDNEVEVVEMHTDVSKRSSSSKLRSRWNTPLVVLNATPKRHCNRRTQYEFAERFGTVPDHVMLIPFIENLDKNHIDIEGYDARTRYHIYDLVYRTFQKLAEINEHIAATAAVTSQPEI
ncbi:MAG: hypothetical protein JWN28_606 [Candidatus Saccharibacteria bacterium]|nr:hypothetical protein [Candidatus Saccharibacteria bacterium]